MSTDRTAPTSHPESTPHPDRDALADFAADVLTDADRDAVSRHTQVCEHCQADLAEIEAVRALLLDDDPGPMPDDVWTRLAATLAEESASREGAGRAEPVLPVAAEAPRLPVEEMHDSSDGRVVPLLRSPDAHILRRPQGRAGRTSRTGRATGRRNLYPVLSAAAALVVLLGGLAVAVQVWSPDSDDAPATTADLALPRPEHQALAAAIRTSGTDYTSSALATQVRALLDRTAAQDAPAKADGRAPAAQAPTPAATADAAREGAALDVTGALRDPEALERCLRSLDVEPSTLVAVDLASFEGREAAIVVLGSPTAKDLEVYAVSRNCGVEGADDGAFSFQRVPR